MSQEFDKLNEEVERINRLISEHPGNLDLRRELIELERLRYRASETRVPQNHVRYVSARNAQRIKTLQSQIADVRHTLAELSDNDPRRGVEQSDLARLIDMLAQYEPNAPIVLETRELEAVKRQLRGTNSASTADGFIPQVLACGAAFEDSVKTYQATSLVPEQATDDDVKENISDKETDGSQDSGTGTGNQESQE